MKKLLFIPMLFVCFMSMGQASAGGGKHFIGENFGQVLCQVFSKNEKKGVKYETSRLI